MRFDRWLNPRTTDEERPVIGSQNVSRSRASQRKRSHKLNSGSSRGKQTSTSLTFSWIKRTPPLQCPRFAINRAVYIYALPASFLIIRWLLRPSTTPPLKTSKRNVRKMPCNLLGSFWSDMRTTVSRPTSVPCKGSANSSWADPPRPNRSIGNCWQRSNSTRRKNDGRSVWPCAFTHRKNMTRPFPHWVKFRCGQNLHGLRRPPTSSEQASSTRGITNRRWCRLPARSNKNLVGPKVTSRWCY